MIVGRGLHTGAIASVRFEAVPGPITLRQGDVLALRDDVVVADTSRSTTVATRDGRLRVATIEHVFAALGGLGVQRGVRVVVDGPEAPLADGGAEAFAAAVAALDLPRSLPTLRIMKDAEILVAGSRYVFEVPRGRARDDGGGDAVELEVAIDFGDARIAERARWNGDASVFRSSIAPARTFGFARELGDLAARGLAAHVAPESVVLYADREVFAAGRPAEPDEPARHKLLDLVGDLFVHGGPPPGRIFAHRPGHAATHEAVRRAFERGVLARREAA